MTMTVPTETITYARVRPPFWRRFADGLPNGTGLFFGYGVLFILYLPIVWLMILSISGEPLTGIPGDWTLTWYEDVIYADIAQRNGKAYGSNFRVGDPLLLSIGLAFATSAACVIGALIVGPVLPRVKRRGRRGRGRLIRLVPRPAPRSRSASARRRGRRRSAASTPPDGP